MVIADATHDVARAADIARMIVDHRAALGGDVVAIGGGDSRSQTQEAINLLVKNGVPVISPNLLADLVVPGKPFVNRPGYLQLTPPNSQYARNALARLCADSEDGFDLTVYQRPGETDHYTNSGVNNVLAEVIAGASTDIGGCAKALELSTARHATETAALNSRPRPPTETVTWANSSTRAPLCPTATGLT